MAPVITLTTDFGTGDAYVASMKGVILSINPKAVIVDICHSVEPQNILQAAFILSTAHHHFPEGTIHLAVVDPGVSSQRKAIVLKTPAAFFLAPDNGVLSYIVDELETTPARPAPHFPPSPEPRELGAGIEAVAITNPDFWRHPVSSTFHGRDIFAPVAAHLSLGVPLYKFGDSVSHIYTFTIPRPYHDTEEKRIGRILHIDNFGNLITNFRGSDLPGKKVTIVIGNQQIQDISQFYAEREGLAAIIGSSGYVEISLRNGSAATFLKANVGDEVRVTQS
ncbi:MAG: SAM-dependent chlorinase/fluorinase [Chloroflexi bacterium]|nr:SAM-dependent chlorinase/fluorinase [Chloroflexota bacterium]MBM3175173.1 SAM-dependent chlorinase/fluorinase [Chloroflexota bacterium]